MTLKDYYGAEQAVRLLGYWIGLIVTLAIGACFSMAYGINLRDEHRSSGGLVWGSLLAGVTLLCWLLALLAFRCIRSASDAVVARNVIVALSDHELLSQRGPGGYRILEPSINKIIAGGVVVHCWIQDRALLNGQPIQAHLLIRKVRLESELGDVPGGDYLPESYALVISPYNDALCREFGPWLTVEKPDGRYWSQAAWSDPGAAEIVAYTRIEYAVGQALGADRYLCLKRRLGSIDLLGFLLVGDSRAKLDSARYRLSAITAASSGEFDWYFKDHRESLLDTFEAFDAHRVGDAIVSAESLNCVVFCRPKHRIGQPQGPETGQAAAESDKVLLQPVSADRQSACSPSEVTADQLRRVA